LLRAPGRTYACGMSAPVWLLVGFALGGLAGAAIGWLMALRRQANAPATNALLGELKQQVAARETELAQVREQFTSASANHAAAQTALAELRQYHEQQLAQLNARQDKALSDLRDSFRALSAEALERSHPEFLRLAGETFATFRETAKGDLSQKEQAIATLIKPLEEHLKAYQERLQKSEALQSGSIGAVGKQLEILSRETEQLRRILNSNQARGRWGEQTLRRVVEAAGLSAHCDFCEQAHSGDGKPDLVIKLPGDRCLIVDAKVPDLEVLASMDVTDPLKRNEALSAHVTKLKATIKALAERDYSSQFPNALDYVVVFLPAESLFSAALEGDQELLVWAANRKILLTTPALLIGLLHCIQVSWQQHEQTENARQIAETAAELYSRVCTFVEHFAAIGAGLERAHGAYNEAVGSYYKRVKPKGEQLINLGIENSGKRLPEIGEVEAGLRPITGNGGVPKGDLFER
jgi:DNA recombination protein RmuC